MTISNSSLDILKQEVPARANSAAEHEQTKSCQSIQASSLSGALLQTLMSEV